MMNDPANRPYRSLYTVQDVRAIDRAAIDSGIAGYELMTRAAQYALDVGLSSFPGARHWQVLCGSGNNAGDGYVLARLAAAKGIAVSIASVTDPAKLTGDAAKAWQDAVATGVAISPFSNALDPQADLLVDALLGSGLTRDVGGAFADAINLVNEQSLPVLSLDLPSGLHGDSGACAGVAVVADVTTTFVGRKPGMYLQEGLDCCGRIRYSDLGIPADCFGTVTPLARLTAAEDTRRWLPRRSCQAHKGRFGHVLVIGGGKGMPGAARLAGEAALRSGAGRVTVAAHPDSIAAIPAARPELMCHGVRNAEELNALLESASVVVLGPGLGRDDWSRELYAAASDCDKPMVVDADALHLLAETPASHDQRVITPHPGEAARLLDTDSASVQADRFAALENLSRRYGGTVVLKGAATLVTGKSVPWLCTAGNPGMASPGMGDVLTGIIAALLAQGLTPEQAAVAGVDTHARAGDVAASAGERGLLATDVIDQIKPWLNG